MKLALFGSLLISSLGAGLIAHSAHAEVLLIERAQEAQGMSLPSRGMSMHQVEAKFGAPQSKRAAVGGGSDKTPPITRWVYANYTVYFENDHVVDAVLNQASPQETGPKPIQ